MGLPIPQGLEAAAVVVEPNPQMTQPIRVAAVAAGDMAVVVVVAPVLLITLLLPLVGLVVPREIPPVAAVARPTMPLEAPAGRPETLEMPERVTKPVLLEPVPAGPLATARPREPVAETVVGPAIRTPVEEAVEVEALSGRRHWENSFPDPAAVAVAGPMKP